MTVIWRMVWPRKTHIRGNTKSAIICANTHCAGEPGMPGIPSDSVAEHIERHLAQAALGPGAGTPNGRFDGRCARHGAQAYATQPGGPADPHREPRRFG